MAMQKKNKKGSSFIKRLINGDLLRDKWVVDRIPFIVFVFSLGIILIANRYHSERVLREIVNLQDTVRDLRSESISIAAELMNLSRPSEVARKVKESGLDLEESTSPPRILYVD